MVYGKILPPLPSRAGSAAAPPRLRDWLPESHLVYFVSDVVDQLDLSAIESVYEKEWRGQPPYHPRLLVKLLV